MRANEFLSERMASDWVFDWIKRSADQVGFFDQGEYATDWFQNFFKILSKDKEFNQWRKQLSLPLSLKARLHDNPEHHSPIIQGEHVMSDADDRHIVYLTFNLPFAPKDAKSMQSFIDRMSITMTHELTHAGQIEQRLKKHKDVDTALSLPTYSIFKTTPPEPTNERETHYLYILENLETDAFISGLSRTILNTLGKDSLKYLDQIIATAKKQDYAVAGGKILRINILKSLRDALDYYEKYLKYTKDALWNKIKKDLYVYLSKSK